MGFSLGFSDSDSQSTSSFDESIPPELIPYLEQMWGGAGDLWNMSMPYFNPMMMGGSSGMDQMMAMMNPFSMDAMSGGVYNDVNSAQNYNTAFQNLMNPSTYSMDLYADIMGGQGNDYVDAMSESIGKTYADELDSSLATLDQRAGLMSGSSGWENAMGDIISNSAEAEAATKAALGYETFDQDLMNKMEIAAMADQNWLNAGTAALDSASGMMGSQQETQFGGLGFGGDQWNAYMQQMMLPFQMAMFYPQMVSPFTTVSGTSASSGDSSGFGFTI
jgi:hypothetical protein